MDSSFNLHAQGLKALFFVGKFDLKDKLGYDVIKISGIKKIK